MQPSDRKLAERLSKILADAAEAAPDEKWLAGLLAVYAEAQRAAVPQWVACSKRMPPHQVPVIAWHSELSGPAEMNYDRTFGWFWADGESVLGAQPTHWMPMPAAPKETQG